MQDRCGEPGKGAKSGTSLSYGTPPQRPIIADEERNRGVFRASAGESVSVVMPLNLDFKPGIVHPPVGPRESRIIIRVVADWCVLSSVTDTE